MQLFERRYNTVPKFMRLLNNISKCQAIFRAENLSVKEITPAHHSIILSLCKNPGCSQDELSKNVCLDKSTVARALSRLEELGYVKRQQYPLDKRKILVYPTDKLELLLPEIVSISSEWTEKISEGIDKANLEVFHSILIQLEQRARALVSKKDAEV